MEILKNIKILDLSYNTRITEIPETLNELNSLEKVTFRGFWMNQNYQSYTNFTLEEVRYYENTHAGRAMSSNRVYKRFVIWLFKLRTIMKKFNFSIEDMEMFERKTENIALRSIKPTRTFKKWLFDRYQTKITSFIETVNNKKKRLKNESTDLSEDQNKKICTALVLLLSVSYGLSLAAEGVFIPDCGTVSTE